VFLTKLKELDPEKIVYIDESGIDSSLYREYARSARGKRVKTDICGKKSERTSLISGWIHQAKEFIAPYAFNGYTDSVRFNQWLEKCLLPVLGEGWTIILDNASFHGGSKTKELVEEARCNLLYLPPYSPDFNPIENQWATLKSSYRTFKQRGYEHANAIDASFLVRL
jgi:transposase